MLPVPNLADLLLRDCNRWENPAVVGHVWERGLESKVYELHIPEIPQVDTAELTEGDLDSIAAGASAAAISIYACCCPCSCS